MKITIADGVPWKGIECTVLSLSDGRDIERVKQYQPLSFPARKCWDVAKRVVARRMKLLGVNPYLVETTYPIEVSDREQEYPELLYLIMKNDTARDEYYEKVMVNQVTIIEEDE